MGPAMNARSGTAAQATRPNWMTRLIADGVTQKGPMKATERTRWAKAQPVGAIGEEGIASVGVGKGLVDGAR